MSIVNILIDATVKLYKSCQSSVDLVPLDKKLTASRGSNASINTNIATQRNLILIMEQSLL